MCLHFTLFLSTHDRYLCFFLPASCIKHGIIYIVGLKVPFPDWQHQYCFVRNNFVRKANSRSHSVLESETWGEPNTLYVNRTSRSFTFILLLEVRITALFFSGLGWPVLMAKSPFFNPSCSLSHVLAFPSSSILITLTPEDSY